MTNSTTRNHAAVLGHPIGHSLSPVLHRAAYRSLGLSWRYDALDVTVDRLPFLMAGLDDSWAGLSLTMPLKEAVLPLLTEVEPLAERLRSVNTVLVTDSGRSGHNTDVYGLVQAIAAFTSGSPGPAVAPQTAVIVGAGATARSAVAALAQLSVPMVRVLARSAASAGEVAALAADLGVAADVVAWPPSAMALQADLVISTLPQDASSVLLPYLPTAPGCLLDVLYEPWPTPLAVAWSTAGGALVGGLEMLVHQAVEQVRLMTGLPVDPVILRAAGLAELDRRNIAQAEQ